DAGAARRRRGQCPWAGRRPRPRAPGAEAAGGRSHRSRRAVTDRAARSRAAPPWRRRATEMWCAILLLALSGAAIPVAAATRPFSVRDIPVGISLTEFRRLHHPDADKHPGAKIYCSTDPGVGGIEALAMPPTLLQADTLKCGFFQLAAAAEGER